MKVAVAGLWHLGTVTAACLAGGGHDVTAYDPDPERIARFQRGILPLFEPGLEERVKRETAAGRLRFTGDRRDAVAGASLVWMTYDTPVDDEDRADVEYVKSEVESFFPVIPSGTSVLISSQLPVGTTSALARSYRTAFPDRRVPFSYSPENLRLGKAIQVFTRPDRVVLGLGDESDKEKYQALWRPFTERIEWMSVESAEMTKHALNAFLAVSVTFANEIAVLCERAGADAKEVERGLKSEERIGPKAYLSPGGAFAGGTLARDVSFLVQLGSGFNEPVRLLSSVRASNEYHKEWIRRKLAGLYGNLEGATIAVWGLTYKPGTSTLRRSSAVELCLWLAGQGAIVRAHDPAISQLPSELEGKLSLAESPLSALKGASALVVATEWPEYGEFPAEDMIREMERPLVIDINRFLSKTAERNGGIRYVTVGRPERS